MYRIADNHRNYKVSIKILPPISNRKLVMIYSWEFFITQPFMKNVPNELVFFRFLCIY